ncbi:putative rab proteins geranylgeranyltransferase component A 2 isoform X2 [Apostichopus japonicus]|uniref:Putative rab proteins geranylgeranyltransferase component A 2 isoform X2 n=1 Tax=Stichopus japonicus TaxID=307972 RepID=A0A2G8JG64_STIJA|nr:putative rab proteins geranylgeranyltransferase component A 2 isoform X2 [Apostichopus japonicus]
MRILSSELVRQLRMAFVVEPLANVIVRRTIKFTSDYSHQQVNFLDVTVRKEHGSLSTDLYTKPTDTHQYLHSSSCHPRHCKSGIAYSQALRLRRICSNNSSFIRHTDALEKHLTARGHSARRVREAIQRVRSLSRSSTLAVKDKKGRDCDNKLPLVVTFHPNLPPSQKITSNNHNILLTSDRLQRAVPEKPIIAYRRPRNLRDLLVRAAVPPLTSNPTPIQHGLQESILAAALARIGRRVLHFDRNNYYSGEWASFHLQGILEWIENYQTPADDAGLSDDAAATLREERPSPDIEDGLTLLTIPNVPSAVYNLTTNRYVSDAILQKEEAKPTEGDTSQSADHVERTDSNQTEGNQQAGSQDGATSVETIENPEGNQQAGSQDSAASVEVSAGNSTELPLTGPDSTQPITNRADHTDISQEPITQSSDTNSTTEDDPVGANADGVENQETEGMVPDDPSDPPDPPSVVDSGEEDHSSNAVGGDDSDNGSAADATRRKIWTWQEIYDQWRKFNIDLAPKLMFCRGNMVDILVQSRISRYAEFKAVTRLLTSINDKLEHVPCSRSDVFSSRYVSMLEKRMLMKLIEFVLHYQDRTDDYEGFKDKPFSEFLQKRKLTPTLQHFVIHSIAMVTASTPTEEALQAMQFFLKSLGRYGNTAFLWTLYGSGELPQCFCRMAAVFGGIYMLRTTATSLILDSANVCKGMIDSEGRRLSCKNVIMDHSYATSKMDGPASFVSRAVLFTDRSLKESQQERSHFSPFHHRFPVKNQSES